MNEIPPKLRTDVDFLPVYHRGKRGVVVRDPLGLISEEIFFEKEILEFIGLLDGKKDIRDIQMCLMRQRGGIFTSREEVERTLLKLDDAFLLDSPHFGEAREKRIAEYSLLSVRQPFLSNRSYPGDADELRKFLENFFQSEKTIPIEMNEKRFCALISPHIDLNTGGTVYNMAYGFVRRMSPKRVLLFGTGHYLQNAFVSVTGKDFITPLGKVRTNKDFVNKLKETGRGILSDNDMAHRCEHSLEIQLIFLQYLFGLEFSIIPILFGSFHSVLGRYERPNEIPGMAIFLESLREYIYESFDETLVIAGVDFSHVGPKFGHQQPALSLLSDTKRYDEGLIDAICKGDVMGLWKIIKEARDRFNVCGFSTIACLLEIFPDSSGHLLGYDVWQEAATQSAVSFAAMVLEQKSEAT